MLRAWIEAMRLRTLPVSVAGVVTATGYAVMNHCFRLAPALLCLLFAVLAQIASNFANEYYDFRDGLDRPGRDGPRRGVTEGDITPSAMKTATFATLGSACVVGLSLIYWGGWQLIIVGVIIAVGVLAYSTGPYPLSRHALGEVAVACFFGVIPVNFTYMLQSGCFTWQVFSGSVAIGLMGANVLIVNNYRDADDDKAVGKTTLAVKFGRRVASMVYFCNGFIALEFVLRAWNELGTGFLTIPAAYLVAHIGLWLKLTSLTGKELNPLLGLTSLLMLGYSLLFLLSAAIA